jgi:signal transduction histidine kinase
VARARHPLLAPTTLAAAVIGALALFNALRWPGTVFPGFLLLDNLVVASAGLRHWPATRDGEIFQRQLLAVDGQPVREAAEVRRYVARLPPGTAVQYTFGDRDLELHLAIETRRFERADFVLLFGPYLVTGAGFLILAGLLRALRRDAPHARGVWAFSYVAGLFALTALDLYGPGWLFRIHVLSEILMFPAGVHMALVFPQRSRLLSRPALMVGLYAGAALFVAIAQAGLYQPRIYRITHGVAVLGIGFAMASAVGAQVHAYFSRTSFEVRQRARLVVLAGLAALAPVAIVGATSALTGGRVGQNLMAFSAVLFPIAIGYGAIRHDLFEVDEIIRRSITYALLTAAVAALNAGLLAGSETLFSRTLENRGGGGLVAIALGVVTVSLLLPLRNRLQSVIDRLFFRSAYDYRRTLESVSQRLASVATLETIERELRGVLSEALHPTRLALFVDRGDGRGLRAVGAAAGVAAPPLPDGLLETADGGLLLPIRSEGRALALLELGPSASGRMYSGQDRRLLLTLAHQSAIAVQNALALEDLAALNRGLEGKVQARTRELEQALLDLRQTQAQLVHREKMASIGKFVAGIAHELNNPLNFVGGNVHFLHAYAADLLRMIDAYEQLCPPPDPSSRDQLEKLHEEVDLAHIREDLDSVLAGCMEGVQRATLLVRDLRTFSRIDQSEIIEADLQETIESTLNLLRGPLRGCEVVRDYSSMPRIQCLGGQLGQVFMNLISNAIDAMEGSGRLTIRTRALDAGRVLVEVQDSGCGIAPDSLSRIFDPFYTTKEVGRGTGLGLSISYGIVERHGGSISVRSEPGAGSCFAVELPVRLPTRLPGDEELPESEPSSEAF